MKRLYRVFIQETLKPATIKACKTPKGALIAVNIANQPNGVYFYRVIKEDGGMVGSGKVVIEK